MSTNRIERINDEILRELSSLIREMKDPRIRGLISLTRVDTARDLRYAKVYFSVLDDNNDTADVLKGLKSAAGFLRREIGQRIKLRQTPELIFERDFSIDRGTRVLNIMKELQDEEAKNEE